MPKHTLHTVVIEGIHVPVKLFRERRASVRASIGKDTVNLRLPFFMTKEEQIAQLQWCQSWLIKQFKKSDSFRARFMRRHYKDGDLFEISDRIYYISINVSDRKTHGGKLENKVIKLELSNQEAFSQRQKSIRTLLSRLIAKDFHPQITRRVLELNHLYFQKPIRSVKLKYNSSNWGSCSSKHNINLSSRLLFAPKDVQDYVIIHELAHLEEMNHSDRFWKIVRDIMPNYKEKEDWLSNHGHICDF